MPSTTTSPARPAMAVLQMIDDSREREPLLEQGLGVLQNLLGMIRLPQTDEEERSALAVLRKFAGDDGWPAGLKTAKRDLLSHLELLTAADVSNHLAWFHERSKGRLVRAWERILPRARR